ncbi:MAG: cell division protein FtsL [Methylococcales bacterium]|nr:cell division protein FtsL [Methylococcales bacterium]
MNAKQLMIALILANLGTGLALIDQKHHSRRLFRSVQQQERHLDQLAIEWGRLQLELTTLTDANRMEQLAREELLMTMPKRSEIVYLKP